MNMLGTLAKVAMGVMVARGVGKMVSKKGSTGGTGGGGLGSILGGMLGGKKQTSGSGGRVDSGGSFGGIDGTGGLGGSSTTSTQSNTGGLGGMLGDLMKDTSGTQASTQMQQAGSAGGLGGLGGLLGGLLGGAGGKSGGLGSILESLGGKQPHEECDADHKVAPSSGGLGGLLNQALGGKAIPEASTAQNAQAEILLRAMLNAAKSDGKFDQQEQAKVMEHLGDVSKDEIDFVRAEIAKPLDAEGFIRSVPRGLEQQVYLMSLLGIDLDSQAEAQYLDKLARGMGISQQAANAIHNQMGVPVLYG